MKILALDIGGTNIKYGLYDEELSEIKSGEVPSYAADGADALLKIVYEVCDKVEFDLLGVSTAGMVAKDGSIAYANENIPGYTGARLKEILEERYGVKTFVLNDIAAGALAETTESAGDFYYLSLGTGVGGIMVKDGMPQIGENGIAGQIGYLPSLFGKGTIDKKASAAGLEKEGGESGKELFEKAGNGETNAIKAISVWAKEVMYVVSMIIGFYDPKTIVIGGGVSKQGQALINRLMKEEALLPVPYRKRVTLKTAKNSSGIVGAAIYAKKRYKEEAK